MSRIEPGPNPYAAQARALKVLRLALILHEAGARRAADVLALDDAQRDLALAALAAGTGRPSTASAQTWRGVASVVGWLGGGSGGRRRISQTVPTRSGGRSR